MGVYLQHCTRSKETLEEIPRNFDRDWRARRLSPSLYSIKCTQCDGYFEAVLHHSPSGAELAIFPRSHGGLRTPNTPEEVAYYVDQAYRCETVRANSAALAMYRAALEQLLYEQGFQKGMLRAKIEALVKGRDDGTAPKWARDLDPAFLTVIKQLGDGAIHPNDGDVSKQSVLDEELLADVKDTFIELLQDVYETPARRSGRLTNMQERARTFDRADAVGTPPATGAA